MDREVPRGPGEVDSWDSNPRNDTVCDACGDTFPAWALRRGRDYRAMVWQPIQYRGEDVFCERCRIHMALVPPFNQ